MPGRPSALSRRTASDGLISSPGPFRFAFWRPAPTPAMKRVKRWRLVIYTTRRCNPSALPSPRDFRFASPVAGRFNGACPKLTRRRYLERQDCWHIDFGDVHAGTIARRVGQPHDQEAWQSFCGFYPDLIRASSIAALLRPLNRRDACYYAN